MIDTSAHVRPSALLVRLALIVLTLAVFSGLTGHPFIAYDDDVYVVHNPHVNTGISLENLGWAFTTTRSSHWHPMTWISHMIDCELFGLDPAGHHLSSLLLHIANVLLLFGLLFRTTGALWRSALAAALFAVHPLHVEPVAWVASRKDLLSCLFLLLALRAYIPYARRGGASWYLLSLFCFALGLLSKSMILTLPCLLFILDVWPLRRLPRGYERNTDAGPSLGAWIFEKIPFVALAALTGVIAVLVMKAGSETVSHAPLADLLLQRDRISRGLFMLVTYMKRAIWPGDLAVIYPPHEAFAPWIPLVGAAILTGGSILVLWHQRPALIAGWFWFLVTLFPLLGALNVGPRVPADRYVYIPLIGLFILVAWAGQELLSRLPRPRLVSGIAAGIAVLALATTSRIQAGYWTSSSALFQQTLRVTSENAKAHNNLGNVLAAEGRIEEAVDHFHAALDIQPRFAEAHNNLGMTFMTLGRTDEALDHFEQALQANPEYCEALNNWGLVLARLGRYKEAAARFSAAVRQNPQYTEALNNLGNALTLLGDTKGACDAYRKALMLRPDHAPSRFGLGLACLSEGHTEEAIEEARHLGGLSPRLSAILSREIARSGFSEIAGQAGLLAPSVPPSGSLPRP